MGWGTFDCKRNSGASYCFLPSGILHGKMGAFPNEKSDLKKKVWCYDVYSLPDLPEVANEILSY